MVIGNRDTQTVLPASECTFVGAELRRPECVLCAADGTLAVSDWRGGVTLIAADGRQGFIHGADWLRPNGIALMPDGSFLIAHLDDRHGGVFRLYQDGGLGEEVMEIDGAALPPTNFVLAEDEERVWITVSTRKVPRTLARHPTNADGFIAVRDSKGVRIAAEGLGYTNEVRFDPAGRHLYVAETWARRLSRFAVTGPGLLGRRETVTEFGAGIYPDGIDFDETGAVWVTSVYSNRVLRLAADGTLSTWLSDSDEAFLSELEEARAAGSLVNEEPIATPASTLGNVSSIAFGGSDRRTAYLGSLDNSRIASFPAPAAGLVPVHWEWPMPPVG